MAAVLVLKGPLGGPRRSSVVGDGERERVAPLGLRVERKHERAELQATKQALKSAVALAVREAPTSTKLWDLANALRQSGMIS